MLTQRCHLELVVGSGPMLTLRQCGNDLMARSAGQGGPCLFPSMSVGSKLVVGSLEIDYLRRKAVKLVYGDFF